MEPPWAQQALPGAVSIPQRLSALGSLPAPNPAAGLGLTHCLGCLLSARPGGPWALPDLHPTWLPLEASCGFWTRDTVQ